MAMIYGGFDLHPKSSTFCLVTRRGRRVAEGEVTSSRRGFAEMIGRCEAEKLRVVLEGSTRSRWAAEVLEGLGSQVVIEFPVSGNRHGAGGNLVPRQETRHELVERGYLWHGLASDGSLCQNLECGGGV